MNPRNVYCHNWHQKGDVEIIALFEVFGVVTMLPNQTIINELKKLKIATLELLEDRTFSSVYRIKQTGIVYQIDCEEGRVLVYNDYEDYKNADEFDALIKLFKTKEAVFIIFQNNGKSFIERKKYPRFTAEITFGNLSDLENIKWIDEIIDPMKMAKAMRKAGEFLKKQTK